MGGIYSVWGAVVAGLLSGSCRLSWRTGACRSTSLLLLFGIGVLQVLATAPGGLADQVPKDLKKLGGLLSRGFGRRADAEGPAA